MPSASQAKPAPASAKAPAASSAILERNLRALTASCPDLAQQLREVEPARDVEFAQTLQGALTASYQGRALASKRRPIDEAERIASQVDPLHAGAAVALGFGLGHHVRAIVKAMREEGLVLVYEPDLPLLRAVLERIDHSDWLGRFGVHILPDAQDAAAISAACHGCEGLLAVGVKIIEHPPSKARLESAATRFAENFTRVFAAVRTVVVTTMVQMQATFRNGLMNLDHYAAGPGVADLKDKCAGFPAIVVSAGPSLARNIALLKQPGVRERCVIVAVQTALKPLLAAGVRPHFVVSLDYHEISKRFYEGLSPEDVKGVALVVEPKANAVVADAFPGLVRCPADSRLDTLLGEELAGEHGDLPAGSTVAHLAHYLARYVGCDPVILVGQDLGFTDGQYYAAGAAIHNVWAGEINPFNTLEMLEWQRIVRGRRTLRKASDHLGRAIYTDEQMATYLAQFERDFLEDERRGLTIIDATEGGVAKAHTQALPLAEAMARFAPAEGARLPDLSPPPGPDRAQALQRATARAEQARRDTGALIERCKDAKRILRRAIELAGDSAAVNPLIEKVHRIRDKAGRLRPAYDLVQQLNQTGGFNRARADRAMRLERDLKGVALQQRQLERDIRNLDWLEQSAAWYAELLDATLAHLREGAPKRTRDPMPDEDESESEAPKIRVKQRVKAAAVVAADLESSGLGVKRDLGERFLGEPILRRTVRRLARCERVESIALLTTDPERARALVGESATDKPVEFVRIERAGARAQSVARARLWAPACWRGGLANLTCYDEVLDAAPHAAALRQIGCDAALVVGGDWALVDPSLCDALIVRHAESPSRHRLTFTQSAPGLAGAVLGLDLLEELAQGASTAGVFASVGAAAGYIPVRPTADPIAASVCVGVPDAVRDAPLRCIPDSGATRTALEAALGSTAGALDGLDAAAIARMVAAAFDEHAPPLPRDITIELTAKRALAGRRQAWAQGLARESATALNRPDMPFETAQRLLEEIGAARSDAVVTFAGAGDPLLRSDIAAIVSAAKDAGVAGVHLRTDLLDEAGQRAESVLEAGCDVLSVDLLATTPATHAQLTGREGFDKARARLLGLIADLERVEGLPTRWIVPRITRCDAVYEEIEPFYDEWIMRAGAAIIDPMPAPAAGERIEPLPEPALARKRQLRDRLIIRSDGSRVVGACDHPEAAVVAPAGGGGDADSIVRSWERIIARRLRDERAG